MPCKILEQLLRVLVHFWFRQIQVITSNNGTEDWLNSINQTKRDLSEDIKSYPPFIVNRCLSGHLDCVLFANEMNKNGHLDKDMQYSFYLNSLRKRKGFSLKPKG